jgi:hypothetical protein
VSYEVRVASFESRDAQHGLCYAVDPGAIENTTRHEEKCNEDKDEYDDDIIAGRVLPVSNRRGTRWIALLVNFGSNIKISIILVSVRLYKQIEQYFCIKRVEGAGFPDSRLRGMTKCGF